MPLFFIPWRMAQKKTAYTFFSMRYYRCPAKKRQSPLKRFLLTILMNLVRRKEVREAPDWRLRHWRIDPIFIIASGLFLATTSGVFGLLVNEPYMAALWADFYLPVFGKPGTPILFDMGVYLLVLGVVLKITFVMAEE